MAPSHSRFSCLEIFPVFSSLFLLIMMCLDASLRIILNTFSVFSGMRDGVGPNKCWFSPQATSVGGGSSRTATLIRHLGCLDVERKRVYNFTRV